MSVDNDNAADLNTRVKKLSELGVPGSAPSDISMLSTRLRAEAESKFPNDSAKQTEYYNKEYAAYVNRLTVRYVYSIVGNAKGEQYAELIKKLSEQQGKLTEEERTLFTEYYKKIQALQNKAIDNWVDLHNKARNDSYAAITAPLQMQASMASLISGIGVIVSMFPDYKDLGQSMMLQGETLARTAGLKIKALEKELDMLDPLEIDRRAQDMRKTYDDKYRNEILRNMGKDLDGKPIEDLYRRLLEFGGNHFVTGRETGAFELGAYSPRIFASKVALMNKPSQYDDELQAAAAIYGLEWRELKLRMVVESDGQALGRDGQPLRSPQGAIGLMQFMPNTAKGLGIDPTDPKQAIHGAARLMAEALVKHGGRSDLMDFEYYGGSNKAAWGPNTKQYVENLKQLRAKTMGQEVFTYDVNGIKLAKGKDPKVTLAPVVDNGTRVASIDPDDGQVITDPANQAFALAQPSPTAPDTLNPAQRAALALVADDPATREERKTTVAVNLPAFTFEKQG